MILDLVATLGGMILPQVFGLVKAKMNATNSEQETISSLAAANPEVLPQYMEATAKITDTQIKWFNRDVIGSPAAWVINLRSAIRPIGVIFGFGLLVGSFWYPIDPGIKLFCEGIVGSWFGSRFDRS